MVLTDKPKSWRVSIATDVADGVKIALYLNACAVIFVEPDARQVAHLKKHVQKIHTVLDSYTVVACPIKHGADLDLMLSRTDARLASSTERSDVSFTSSLSKGMSNYNRMADGAKPSQGERRTETGSLLWIVEDEKKVAEVVSAPPPVEEASIVERLASCRVCEGTAPHNTDWPTADVCSLGCLTMLVASLANGKKASAKGGR